MRTKVTNPKAIQNKSRLHQITPIDNGQFLVTSGVSGEVYTVRLQPSNIQGAVCNCNWGQRRPRHDAWRSGCSHVVAVFNYLEQTGNRSVSVWTSEDDVKKQHRSSYAIGDGVTLTSKMKYEPKRFRLWADNDTFEVVSLKAAREKWLEIANTFKYKTWKLEDLTLKVTHSQGVFRSR